MPAARASSTRLVAGIADRIRPWAAPDPPPGAPRAIVVGAGAAGLATAALLRLRGVAATVLDERGEPGGAWPDRYDSLRLNTVRWMSDLPGLRLARPDGRWVGRDDFADYLRRYADHHGLTVTTERVDRIEPAGAAWAVHTGDGRAVVDAVAVATGHSRVGVVPPWKGRDEFAGRVLHSSDYRRPADHAGRRVVVVGAGSSGGEICLDLVAHGIEPVWSVRSAPHVFPREAAGVPTTPFAPVGDLLPAPLLDRTAPWIERAIHGRRDYLPPPPATLTALLDRHKEPMTADGIVDAIRDGSVTVVAPVERLHRTGAVLTDGTVLDADDVVAATGYRSGLDDVVGHLGVLSDGRPTTVVPRSNSC